MQYIPIALLYASKLFFSLLSLAMPCFKSQTAVLHAHRLPAGRAWSLLTGFGHRLPIFQYLTTTGRSTSRGWLKLDRHGCGFSHCPRPRPIDTECEHCIGKFLVQSYCYKRKEAQGEMIGCSMSENELKHQYKKNSPSRAWGTTHRSSRLCTTVRVGLSYSRLRTALVR